MKSYFCLAALLVGVGSQLASAQWLNYPTPGIPRTPDGKPNLSAPAPRIAEGKPDLTGVWVAVGDRVGGEVVRNRHGINIAVDLAGGAPFTPWARAIYDERRKNQSRDIPTARCLPAGIPPDMLRPTEPFKIIQTSSVTIILFEAFNNWRQVFADGRGLPLNPQPAWFGYSVGRWEGNTFVVETTGFNNETWLDGLGTPHSDALRLTERFKRPDFGHMEIEYTFDDPKAFSKSFSATVKFELLPDTELLDHQCENEKDAGHLVGK